MYKFWIVLVLVMILPATLTLAQAQATPPAIVTFTSELPTISLADAEAGQRTTRLAWTTSGVTTEHTLQLYAYEINAWVLVTENPLAANGSFVVTVRHPLNFNPPTYRLVIADSAAQVLSESVIFIPYEPVIGAPALTVFSSTQTSLSADELLNGTPEIPVSWQVTNRTPNSNLLFEQVLPDGLTLEVDFPRPNEWVSSQGSGVIGAVFPEESTELIFQLRLVDLGTNATLAQRQITMAISDESSVAVPVPQPTLPPPSASIVTGSNPPPIIAAGSSGAFELGGHVTGFDHAVEMRVARMGWAKIQLRWQFGSSTNTAAAAITQAHLNGFKILLGISGNPAQMNNFDAYTSQYATFLGQVAALNPDAIEVWNEPNLAREWVPGSIDGAAYTLMLAKAYNAIKSANPNVLVISAGLAPTGFFEGTCTPNGCDDAVFLQQMVEAGAANYLDCVGAHYIEGIVSPTQTSDDPRGEHYSRYMTSLLETYTTTFSGSRQICWTELGYLTSEGYGALSSNFIWASNTTLAHQAQWLGEAATLSLDSQQVRLMIVWNVDFEGYSENPQGGYAIVRADGSCPACVTLRAALE